MARVVSDGDIEMLIAVQISGRDSERISRYGKIPAGEISVAVAKQNGNRTAFKVRGDDVRIADFVKVGGAQPLIRHLADIEFRARSLKRAVAFTEYHEHFIFGPTIYGDVRFLITIEIRDCDSMRMRVAFNAEWCTWRE